MRFIFDCYTKKNAADRSIHDTFDLAHSGMVKISTSFLGADRSNPDYIIKAVLHTAGEPPGDRREFAELVFRNDDSHWEGGV